MIKKKIGLLKKWMVSFLNKYPTVKAFAIFFIISIIYFTSVKIVALYHADSGEARVKEIWANIPVRAYIHVRYFKIKQMPIEHVLTVIGTSELPKEEIDCIMRNFLGDTYRLRNGYQRVGLYDGYTVKYWLENDSGEWVFIICPDEDKRVL